MAVRNGTHHLSEEMDGKVLWESSSGVDKGKEIALIDILENEISVLRQQMRILTGNVESGKRRKLTFQSGSPICRTVS